MREIRDEAIDEAIEKCERIQEIATEINGAFGEIIDIFRQAARDCEAAASEVSDD